MRWITENEEVHTMMTALLTFHQAAFYWLLILPWGKAFPQVSCWSCHDSVVRKDSFPPPAWRPWQLCYGIRRSYVWCSVHWILDFFRRRISRYLVVIVASGFLSFRYWYVTLSISEKHSLFVFLRHSPNYSNLIIVYGRSNGWQSDSFFFAFLSGSFIP